MKHILRLALIACLLLSDAAQAVQAADETFQFFEEEAKVVSASRIASSRTDSPSTVYVVTSQEIADSGAQNFWDVLRSVPGLDVIQTNTDQGQVSVRGLNNATENRTLILVDGRTVLEGLFDTIVWEEIPVSLDEVERIEVVEGPASAVYGANAVNGVINIITKTPEQLSGGKTSYTAGERNTQLISAVYGNKTGKWGYKLGSSGRYINRFDDASQRASESAQFNGLLSYSASKDSRLSLSGGVSRLNTQYSVGSPITEDGHTNFARADYKGGGTDLRAFWNHGQANQPAPSFNQTIPTRFDIYDLNLDHLFKLPGGDDFLLGAGYRSVNIPASSVFPKSHHEDQYDVLMENKWKPFDSWTFWLSGRVDKRELTPWLVSPRASIVYSPEPSQSLRLSAGTAFRHATPIEKDLGLVSTQPNAPGGNFPNPPFTSIIAHVEGNETLSPEKIRTLELSHSGQFGPVKTALTGFYYELRDVIGSSNPQLVSAVPPAAVVDSSFANFGRIVGRGAEMSAEMPVRRWATVFANYSYEFLKGSEPMSTNVAQTAPKHKVNAGLTAKSRGLTGSLSMNWVDKTMGTDGSPVSAYFLLNAHLGYAFAGRWEGLEAGVNAFNLAANNHFELPSSQAGELLRARWTGTVSYKFGGSQ